jgi:hypothetical protein
MKNKSLLSVFKVKIEDIYNQITDKTSFVEEFKLRGIANYYEDKVDKEKDKKTKDKK